MPEHAETTGFAEEALDAIGPPALPPAYAYRVFVRADEPCGPDEESPRSHIAELLFAAMPTVDEFLAAVARTAGDEAGLRYMDRIAEVARLGLREPDGVGPAKWCREHRGRGFVRVRREPLF